MQVSEVMGNGRMPGPRTQLYGIEIEVEHVDHWPDWVDGSDWMCVDDGSLRNHGREFITPPVTYDRAQAMLREYYQYHHMNGYEASLRTGTHVHADMTWRSMEQVAAICCLYALLEPLFFDLCGPDREECIYCVPWYRAPDDAVVLADLLQQTEWRQVHRRLDMTCKYGALYIEPLRRLGTIEFRAAPTFNDVEDMARWLLTVRRCVSLGHYYGTPERVLEAADRNLQRLVQFVFPDRYSAQEAEALLEGMDTRSVAQALVVRTTPFRWVHNMEEPQDRAGIYYQHAQGGVRAERVQPLYHLDDEFESVFDEPEWEDDEEDY